MKGDCFLEKRVKELVDEMISDMESRRNPFIDSIPAIAMADISYLVKCIAIERAATEKYGQLLKRIVTILESK